MAHSYQILAFSVGLTALLVMGESWAADAPKYDYRTEQSFRVGGKEFVGPREYWARSRAAFYWPSRSPAFTGAEVPEEELVKKGKFFEVAVELFIEVAKTGGETFELVTEVEAKGTITTDVQVRPGLRMIKRRSRPGELRYATLYVATDLHTRGGKPPTASCREEMADDICTSRLPWNPGFSIHVRFNNKHAKDWPEIYPEIVRVLNTAASNLKCNTLPFGKV